MSITSKFLNSLLCQNNRVAYNGLHLLSKRWITCEEALKVKGELVPVHEDCAKDNRKYSKTWKDCPPPVKCEERLICPEEEDTYAIRVPSRRGSSLKPKTVFGSGNLNLSLSSCSAGKSGETKCPKIRLPGCPDVINLEECKRPCGPSNCERNPNPTLSYSEMERGPWAQKHPHECECWLRVCEESMEECKQPQQEKKRSLC